MLFLLSLVGMMIGAASQGEHPVGGGRKGEMVGRVVKQHLTGCHLVFLSSAPNSHLASSIIWAVTDGMAVLDASMDQQLVPKNLWGEARTTCRALILQVDNNSNTTNAALSLLERTGLRKSSDARVVVVGGKDAVDAVLLHPTLRNTVHAIYLAITNPIPFEALPKTRLGYAVKGVTGESDEQVWVYRRCLYCSGGQPAVKLVLRGGLDTFTSSHPTTLFAGKEQLDNMEGLELRGVTVPYFPYMAFTKRTGEESEGSVILEDSLDVRILSTFAMALNFSFKIYAEPNRSFGEEKKTGFTGMIGQVQREESDLSTIVAPTPGRLKVVDYLRTYPSDPLVLTSLKPTVLPAHLSLIRPFSSMIANA